MSQSKAKALLEDWSNCLQMTITEMYVYFHSTFAVTAGGLERIPTKIGH